MSPQSPNSSSVTTDHEPQGEGPAAGFGPNEWLVDEIYQQYLQDPNSVDRAWWDFFADYKPDGSAATAAPAGQGGASGAAARAATAPVASGQPVPPAPAATIPAPPAPAAPAPA
ncbi:2-oxoglutarate dehydrogenase E1 subunit family protein, partial [Actinacidiphila cocklensis]|uniref:2-oxoglutarate dehydrogenase E1 subunit family protein n=1 Tax=Actinacidiphila cocklensis TaxID=887465 RepID=UPI00203AC8B1